MAVIIRDATIMDAQAISEIYAPYVKKTAITFEYTVPNEKEMAHRIETISKNNPYIVAEEDGVVIGYAYAAPLSPREAYQWSVETSIYVALKKQHAGIGRLLYEALEERLKVIDHTNLYACIAYGDDEYLDYGSVKFHEKLGYQTVGHFHQCGYKFDRWYDIIWMEKKLVK